MKFRDALWKTSVFFFQIRAFQTSATQQDIDQAAKYIGAGAATVGAAGSGNDLVFVSLSGILLAQVTSAGVETISRFSS